MGRCRVPEGWPRRLPVLWVGFLMTSAEMEALAWGAIERHLGDVAEESEDALYDEAYTIACDALVDAGCPLNDCRSVAQSLAQRIAQP